MRNAHRSGSSPEPNREIVAKPPPLSVDVEIFAPLADLEIKAGNLLDRRKALRVDSKPTFLLAVALAKEIKGVAREMAERCDPYCDLYRGRLDRARKWEREHIDPLDAAEKDLKGEYTRWQDEQDRIAEEARRREQAKRDEEARIERERMETALRAETEKRREAERVAAEEKKRADMAAAKRMQADADKRAAEARSKSDRERAERLQREADAAKAKAEADRKAELARIEERRILDAEAARRQAEETVLAPIVEAAERVPAVEGSSRRDAWSARMTDRVAFVRWLAARPDDLIAELVTEKVVAAFLVPLNQQARSLRRAMHVDGVTAVCETIQSLTRTRAEVG